MRKIPALILFILLAIAPRVFADGTPFQVRLVVPENEAKDTDHDSFIMIQDGKPVTVLTAKEPVLTAEDVSYAVVRVQKSLVQQLQGLDWRPDKSGNVPIDASEISKFPLTGDPAIEFVLTDTGNAKWSSFCAKNMDRKAAVIGNNLVFAEPVLSPGEKLEMTAPTENVGNMAQMLEGMNVQLKARAV